jgi:hypothetical protein
MVTEKLDLVSPLRPASAKKQGTLISSTSARQIQANIKQKLTNPTSTTITSD